MPVEGTWRCPPGAAGRRARRSRRIWRQLEAWLRSRTGRRSCSTTTGGRVRELAALAADRRPADEREPARQRWRCCAATCDLPDFARLRASTCRARGRRSPSATRVLGSWLRDVMARNREHATSACSDRTRPVQPAGRRLRGRPTEALDGRASTRRRPLSPRGPGDGDALRAHLPGLAGGLPAHRPARPVLLLRGVHPHRRLDVQPARQVAQGEPRTPVAAPDRVAELPAHRRTSGGRTTTASRTRIPASSTTW